MGPSTNWLSFSVSPMEMLRSSESQFMSYENSSTDSPHYLIDNFYTNANTVAHVLAPYARNIEDELVWLEESPPPAFEALYFDSP
uniref:Uncharacterized protein n=1 Tax=Quercus lobata TaxID=97700 RepID=A0A7N2MBL0_QUELO